MEPEFLLVNLRVDFNNDCSADKIKKVFVEAESKSRRT
jgi:hypothetical protein